MKFESWVHKYRPRTLDDGFIVQENHRKIIKQLIDNKLLPQPLLVGNPGTGKTTLRNILLNELNVQPEDILVINCGEEDNKVETIRNRVKTFISSQSFGDFKVVVFEEANTISFEGQETLKTMTEEWERNARFILSTNHLYRINEAIRSRCQTLEFKGHAKDDIVERCLTILINEGITFEPEIVIDFVNRFYPDIRKTINELQSHCINNILQSFRDKKSQLWEDDFKKILLKSDFKSLRKYFLREGLTDWEILYRLLYENIENSNKFKDDKWKEGIITIVDYMDKSERFADKQIVFDACLISLDLLANS